MKLASYLIRVLKEYPYKKLLIALSGGPDSMALLHLLLAIQKELSLDLAVAHINHQWREESGQEAEFLKKMILSLKLPFFSHTIQPGKLQGNLEEASRDARHQFFESICCIHGYEAVVLAHHANDQAETVLKRCLEGASIFSLHGMEKEKKRGKLTVLRPLLEITKQEMVTYLNDRNLTYFNDPTNDDPRFLRGKMRKSIFPLIEQEFGKNSQRPLNRLARESLELRDYIRERMGSLKANLLEVEWGICMDVREIAHLLEIKWMISNLFLQKKVAIRQALIHQIAGCLYHRQANKKFLIQDRVVYCDRGHLFLLHGRFFNYTESKTYMENQEILSGTWKIKFETFKRNEIELLGWKNAFLGHCRAILPKGTYSMGFPKKPFSDSLIRLWSKTKVPAFIRSLVPILYNCEGAVALEFLSGKKLVKCASGENEIMVSLYRE
ncbi:MAG: tRNA lysidine(34) synthetase TilS [Parachlamydiaceae bacterium]